MRIKYGGGDDHNESLLTVGVKLFECPIILITKKPHQYKPNHYSYFLYYLKSWVF